MREILFRSWNIIDDCFYYFENGTYYYFGEKGSRIIVEEFVFNWENAQQFTGILDRKGNKIFEGDKVKLGGSVIFVVDFINGAFRFKNSDTYILHLDLPKTEEIEIIGNIHEDGNK